MGTKKIKADVEFDINYFVKQLVPQIDKAIEKVEQNAVQGVSTETISELKNRLNQIVGVISHIDINKLDFKDGILTADALDPKVVDELLKASAATDAVSRRTKALGNAIDAVDAKAQQASKDVANIGHATPEQIDLHKQVDAINDFIQAAAAYEKMADKVNAGTYNPPKIKEEDVTAFTASALGTYRKLSSQYQNDYDALAAAEYDGDIEEYYRLYSSVLQELQDIIKLQYQVEELASQGVIDKRFSLYKTISKDFDANKEQFLEMQDAFHDEEGFGEVDIAHEKVSELSDQYVNLGGKLDDLKNHYQEVNEAASDAGNAIHEENQRLITEFTEQIQLLGQFLDVLKQTKMAEETPSKSKGKKAKGKTKNGQADENHLYEQENTDVLNASQDAGYENKKKEPKKEAIHFNEQKNQYSSYAKNVEKLKSSSAAAQDDIDKLTNSISQLIEKLGQAQTETKATDLSGLSGDFAQVTEKISAVTEKIDAINGSITTVTENIKAQTSTIESLIIGLVTRLDILQRTYKETTLANSNAPLNIDATAILESIEKIIDKFDELQETIKSISSEELQDNIGHNTVVLLESIDRVSLKLEEFKSSIRELSSDDEFVDVLGHNFMHVLESIDSVSIKLESLRQDLHNLTADDGFVETLGYNFLHVLESIDKVSLKVEELRTNFKGVSSDEDFIDSLGHNFMYLMEKVDQTTAKIEELRTNFRGVSSDEDFTDALGHNFMFLMEKVDQVTAKIEELRQDLRLLTADDGFSETLGYNFLHVLESIDKVAARVAELREDLKTLSSDDGFIDTLGHNFMHVLEAIDGVTRKLDELKATLETISTSVHPVNITSGIDQQTIDALNNACATLTAFATQADLLIKTNTNLSESFKKVGKAAKDNLSGNLFDAGLAIQNHSKEITDSSDNAIRAYLTSHGSTQFNVMDRSMEATKDGLVKVTTSVNDGTGKWKKFITTLKDASTATVTWVGFAGKLQRMMERLQQEAAVIKSQKATSALFDVNNTEDLDKWSNILKEIESTYKNIGTVQQIIYNTRQDKRTGALLESFLVRGDKGSVTFGPEGEAVASNQDVLGVEQLHKKISALMPDLKDYYSLKAKFETGDATVDEVNRYKRIDAAIKEINADFAEYLKKAENLDLKNFATDNLDKMNEQLSSSFNKYLSDLNVKTEQAITSAEILRKNSNVGMSPELQAQIQSFRAAAEEINKIISSHGNGESWASGELQKAESFVNRVKDLRNSLKGNDTKLVDFMQITKLREQVAEFMNKNSAMSRDLKKQFQSISNELQEIGIHAETAGGKIGEIDKIKLRGIQSQFQDLKAQVAESGNTGLSTWDKIRNAVKSQNAQFIGMYFSFFDMIRYARQAVDVVKQVNSAMIELKKVSNESTVEVDKSFKNMAASAQKLGSSVSEIINLTADWSRLGYNLQDSQKLAGITRLYANVGDGISTEEASESLISTLRGFRMQADEAESIVDKFNEVGNNFAISSAGIGEALKRSAASFDAAHTNLDQSIALVTATNEIVQDPDSVGNLWKTVSARIRGAKTELEDMGEDTDGMVTSTSKLRDLVKGITGVDIMTDKNTFKDIYTIVLEIGKVWPKLSDINRASLLESLAGKRNANGLAAVLNNVDHLQEAYESATDSAGSARREQEKYSQSISYHTKQFQASVQTLISDLISSGAINTIIDMGTGFIKILDTITKYLGGLPSIIGIILAGVVQLKGSLPSLFTFGDEKNSGFFNFHKIKEEAAETTVSNEQVAASEETVAAATDRATIAQGKNAAKQDVLQKENAETAASNNDLAFRVTSDSNDYKDFNPKTANDSYYEDLRSGSKTSRWYKRSTRRVNKADRAFKNKTKRLAEKEAADLQIAAEKAGAQVYTTTGKDLKASFEAVTTKTDVAISVKSKKAIEKAAADCQIAAEKAGVRVWRQTTEEIPDILRPQGDTKKNAVGAEFRLRNGNYDMFAEETSTNFGKTRPSTTRKIRKPKRHFTVSNDFIDTTVSEFKDIKEARQVVKEYNALTSSGKTYQKQVRKLAASHAKFGNQLIAFDKQANGAAISISDLGVGLTKTTIASKAAAFGMQALGLAMSTIVGIGIGMLISFVVGKLTELAHSAENARDSAIDTYDAYKNMRDELQENSQLVKENGERYIELSKGVDAFNRNLTLSADDYAEYLDLNKQMAEAFPDLVTGYDAEGNAIIRTKDNVEALTEALKEKRKEQDRQAVYGDSDDNGKANHEDYAENWDENVAKAIDEQKMDKKYAAMSNDKLRQHAPGLGAGASDEDVAAYRTKLKNKIEEAQAIIDDGKSQIQSELLSMFDSASIENELSENATSLGNSIIQGLDESFYNDHHTVETLQPFVDNLIKNLKDNPALANSLFESIANLNQAKATKTTEDYVKYEQDLINKLKEIAGDPNAKVEILFGLDEGESPEEDLKEKIKSAQASYQEQWGTTTGKGKKKKTTYEKKFGSEAAVATDEGEAAYKNALSTLTTAEFDQTLAWKNSKDQWTQYAKEYSKALETVTDKSTAAAIAIKKVNESLNGQTEATKKSGKEALSTLQNNMAPTMDALGTAYDSIFHGGDNGKTFDMSAVTMDQLQSISDAVDKLNDNELGIKVDSSAVDTLVNTLGNTSTTANQAQKAFDNFATVIVDAVIPNIDELDDSSYAMAKQALEEMGVQNAEEVLLTRLGGSLDDFKKAKQEAASIGLKTNGDVQNLSSLNIAAIGSRKELIAYILQKIRTNQITVKTAGDISNLIALGKAAGWTAAQLSAAEAAKIHFSNLEKSQEMLKGLKHNTGAADTIKQLEEQKKAITDKVMQDAMANFNTSFSVDFGGGNSSNSGGKGSKGNSKGKGSGKSSQEQTIDWIEREQKRLSDSLTDIQGVIDDTYDDWGTRLGHVTREYANLNEQITFSQQAMQAYMKAANSVGLSPKYAAKVRNGTIQIEKITDETLKNQIDLYEGYYDKYVQYEQQYNNLLRERISAIEKELDLISGVYEDINEDCEHIIAMEAINDETGTIQQRISANLTKRGATERELNNTITERAKLAKEIAHYTGQVNSEGYHDLQKRLNDLDEKANDLRINLQSLAKERFDLLTEQFDNMATAIDHMANRISSLSDLATAMGGYSSKEFINANKAINQGNLEVALREKEALEAQLKAEMQNGSIAKGTATYHEMQEEIEGCTDKIFDLTAAIAKNDQELRQWQFDAQDYIRERTQRIFDTNDFMVDQLGQEKLFEENGGWKASALASQGLYTSSYSIYLAEAKEYAKAIGDINKELESDPYDVDLIARRETLIDKQRDMINGANKEKEAIKDLVKDGYDTFLNYLQKLIDKRKEALDAEQDLYEYEKNIREQTTEIGSYQKQLASLNGDKSEENQLRLQQLQNSLKQSQEKLQETEHDKWKSDQEQMMDRMYNDFETIINKRLDDVNGLLQEAIQMTQSGAGTIVSTISQKANDLGVDITSSINVLNRNTVGLETQFSTIATDIEAQSSAMTAALSGQATAIVNAGDALALKVSGDKKTTLDDILEAINRIVGKDVNPKDAGNPKNYRDPSQAGPTTTDYKSTYSLYNPNGGNHVLTSDEDEVRNLVSLGWVNEGEKFKTANESNIPVYRVYNPNNGDHLLTTSDAERKFLVGQGWSEDAVKLSASETGKAVYRLYNPNNGQHHFTTDKTEADKLERLGWKKEGIAFHVLQDAAFAKGGTIGQAINRTGEDGFILARTGEEVLSLEKIKEMQKVLGMFQPLAHLQRNIPRKTENAIGGGEITIGDITTTLSLPNVRNYEDFVNEAKADPRFEKLVTQITLGNALGQNKLKKFSI